MQVDIGETVGARIQSLVSFGLNSEDYQLLAEWLIMVGVEAVEGLQHEDSGASIGEMMTEYIRGKRSGFWA